MAEVSTFLAWAQSIERMSYYAILQVQPNAPMEAIKDAFHAFAMRCHPDRYVDDGPEVAAAAAQVFKRGVEAYNVLSKPPLRARYDDALRAGRLRMDPNEIPKPKPAPQAPKSLESIARTEEGKSYARRADHLASVGRKADARAQLMSACALEPQNQELLQRLAELG